MAGTLTVQNLQGPSSGANANKVIIPSGQTLDASNGFVAPAGHIVQVVTSGTTSSQNTSSSSWVDIWRPTFTPKYNDSTLHFAVSLNVLNEASNTTDIWIGWRGVNGIYYNGFGKAGNLSGWAQNNNAVTYLAPSQITTQGELWIQLRGNGTNLSYWNYNSGNGAARSIVTMWEVR